MADEMCQSVSRLDSAAYTYATQTTISENKPAAKPEEQGSVLGWFACSVLTGVNFTAGASYDWVTGKCKPQGNFVSRIWHGGR
ncbi:MAG: hypothetical protein WC956_05055 [bacterium]